MIRVFAVWILAATVAGCAVLTPRPNTSPEAQLAIYGRQIIGVANGVLTTVELLTDQRLVNIQLEVQAGKLTPDQAKDASDKVKADARAIIHIVQQIGLAGGQLADALTLVDLATTGLERGKALDQSRQLLLSVQRLVQTGLIQVGDDTTRKAVATMLGQITELLFQVALTIPQGSPGGR